MSTPGRARIHHRGEMCDVVTGQQLGELRLERDQFAELADVGELRRIDAAVVVFGEDQRIDHTDGPRIAQRDSSAAISPVKLLAPAGNSTTT